MGITASFNQGPLITSGTVFVTADSTPRALELALNYLERYAEKTDKVACIETYTATLVDNGRYQIDFA